MPLPAGSLNLDLFAPVNCALATMVAARRTARHALGTARLAAQGAKCLIFGAGMLGVYGCALFHDLGMQGRKLVSCSQCQEMGQRANMASDWQPKDKEPIRSQVCSLTKLLT